MNRGRKSPAEVFRDWESLFKRMTRHHGLPVIASSAAIESASGRPGEWIDVPGTGGRFAVRRFPDCWRLRMRRWQ